MWVVCGIEEEKSTIGSSDAIGGFIPGEFPGVTEHGRVTLTAPSALSIYSISLSVLSKERPVSSIPTSGRGGFLPSH